LRDRSTRLLICPRSNRTRALAAPLPHCARLSGEIFPARTTFLGVVDIHQKSSCADLIRASTSLFRPLEGRGWPGKTRPRRNPGADFLLFGRKIFPGQPSAFAGESAERGEAGEGCGAVGGNLDRVLVRVVDIDRLDRAGRSGARALRYSDSLRDLCRKSAGLGGAARTRPQTLMRRRQGTPADRRDRGLRQGPVHDVPLRAAAADLL
jgi:hypothetical protein